MNFYKNQLNQEEQIFCNELYKSMILFTERIKAPRGLSFDEVSECVTAVKYDHPELFYINFAEGLYYNYSDYYEYHPKYHYRKEDVEKKNRTLEILCQRVTNTLRSGRVTSSYKKVLWVHNMLVRNCTYDHDALDDDSKYQAYTLEGPLFNRRGVCQGIAMAFKYLCSKCCGIDMIIARGRSLEPGQTQYERHAWNIILFDTNAAHIDVTWDMYITEDDHPIRYDYFFLSDIEMMRDHHFIGYPECKASGMSFFEQTKTQFRNQLELRVSLMHKIEEYFRRNERNTLCFTFKIKNRRETKEELNECVKKQSKPRLQKGFSIVGHITKPNLCFLFGLILFEDKIIIRRIMP